MNNLTRQTELPDLHQEESRVPKAIQTRDFVRANHPHHGGGIRETLDVGPRLNLSQNGADSGASTVLNEGRQANEPYHESAVVHTMKHNTMESRRSSRQMGRLPG